MIRRVFSLIWVLFSSQLLLSQAVLRIDTVKESLTYGTFYIEGVSQNLSLEEIQERFHVFVKGARSPVIGNYSTKEGSFQFSPRFLPDTHVIYEVKFRDETGRVISENVQFATTKNSSLRLDIYPKSKSVPSNILRVYLYFSQPMGLANPLEFIRLLNEEGETINEPFVEVKEGLWNQDRTRLTLFFHPGRIKRGVGPNLTMGPVLEPEKTYSLILSKDWKDAYGRILGQPIIFEWRTTDPIREKLEISTWEISASVDKLHLNTKRILDYDITKHSLLVSKDGRIVQGSWSQSDHQLVFDPFVAFEIGNYQLVVLPRLEDICGNNIYSAFEEANRVKMHNSEEQIIPFEVK